MSHATIPNKLYFRIGEVATLLDIKPYVLRYWETEFPEIKPTKSKSGQRLYKKRDVELLWMIRDLLYEERFTIDGARKRLKEIVRDANATEGNPSQGNPLHLSEPKPAVTFPAGTSKKVLAKIKKDLEDVLLTLSH